MGGDARGRARDMSRARRVMRIRHRRVVAVARDVAAVRTDYGALYLVRRDGDGRGTARTTTTTEHGREVHSHEEAHETRRLLALHDNWAMFKPVQGKVYRGR